MLREAHSRKNARREALQRNHQSEWCAALITEIPRYDLPMMKRVFLWLKMKTPSHVAASATVQREAVSSPVCVGELPRVNSALNLRIGLMVR